MTTGGWRWLWRGDLPAAAVTVDFDAAPPDIPAALAAEADALWHARRAAPGAPRLFDGELAQLRGWDMDAGGLHLALGRTRYRLWLASAGRRGEIETRFGPGAASRPLAFCAAVLVDDGRLVVLERGAAVAEGAGLLHVPGGHLEPDRHRRRGRPDPRTGMLAELSEELALSPADLDAGRLLGLGESGVGKPELLFAFRCRLDEGALRRRAAAARDAFEHAALQLTPAVGPALRVWAATRAARLAEPSRALVERLLAAGD
ncbi:MAG: NUDIX hydrolase [Candidatus Krumholzibacteriota bacterium]|nr:NUDIX hydrolase [Candidatus Krumholzibacteriota bacterium]